MTPTMPSMTSQGPTTGRTASSGGGLSAGQPWAAALAVGLAVLALLHVVLTRLSWAQIPLQTDTGMWAYIGSRILDGARLYRDLWESKPPGIYYTFAAMIRLFGMLDRILPVEDDDISKLAQRVFAKQGMTFHTGHTIKTLDLQRSSSKTKTKKAAGVVATIVNAKDESKTLRVECDVLLVAVGVAGRFDGLFADDLKVAIDRDHIKVAYRDVAEPTYLTSAPGIHAVGDVIGPPWLAHVAMEEPKNAAWPSRWAPRVRGGGRRVKPATMPRKGSVRWWRRA